MMFKLLFSLGSVMCMGVTAGAYILTLFAVCSYLFLTLSHNPVPRTNIVFIIYLFYALKTFQMKHKDRVLGLILVSPLCKAPSWSEWFYNKVISNLLYFYGMCGVLKEFLLQRYFSKVR